MTRAALKSGAALQMPLAALAQASVQQLREAIRRVTALHAPPGEPTERDPEEFLFGVDVSEAGWTDWEETTFDVRQFHG